MEEYCSKAHVLMIKGEILTLGSILKVKICGSPKGQFHLFNIQKIRLN
jgi:hypothetical protein